MHGRPVLRVTYLILVPVFLLAVLYAPACGNEPNDQRLSSEEYFNVLASSSATINDELDNLLENSGSDSVEDLKEYLTESDSIVENFMDSLREVNPPAGAEIHHDKMLEATSSGQAMLREFSDKIEGVASLAEASLLAREMGESLSVVTEAQDKACGELQEMADEQGLGLDLRCDG